MQLGEFQGETRAEARGRTRGWMHLATKFVCRLCGTSPRQHTTVFAACAEPTPDNQYTTFKPNIMKRYFRVNICRLCGTNSRRAVFAACAEPTPDNQYTTFKPTLRLTRSRFNCVFAACAEPTPHHQYTTFKPTHIHQISFSHMRLPLMRNHLLTTSTPHLKKKQS